MKQQPDVKIAPAKGRPMLSWVGKRPLTHVPAFPAQHIETFSAGGEAGPSKDVGWSDWPDRYPQGGLLFHGDNKEVLAHLLASGFRGKVKLIYIDPPFDSGADYVRKVNLRGVAGVKVEGESYSLGEQIQYTDIWTNDNYLQFMYERLLLLKELLAPNGSIFVHCDHRKNSHLRVLLDEVFGADSLVNEIVWRSTVFTGSSKSIANRYPTNHNTIFWYKKGDTYVYNKIYDEYRDGYVARFSNPDDDPRGEWQSVSLKTYSQETFDRLKQEGRLIPPRRQGAGWRFKYYLADAKGKVFETIWLDSEVVPGAEEKASSVSGLWLDINMANAMAAERTGYPTEKPDELLARIIAAHSDVGDIVLDCFIGSGTTAAVAQKLGRRWIGCDINNGAIQTTSKRLQSIIRSQADEKPAAQQELDVDDAATEADALPAQLGFTVWRVNDYDLQIQHNEAVELACEHIGIERSRTDGFFDGTLGKRLVKIVPFGHPLSPVDLEEVKRELEARPEEDRDIVMVCLGKELAADAWLEEWNQLRRVRGGAPNRIEAIELRSDPKYGKFIAHRPAEARVDIRREKKKIIVEVQDFISPTIVERLDVDVPLFRAKIPDWRSMVDCVMIDAAHDGAVFNVTLSDVPEKRDDLVAGRYELMAPKGKTTVAVKIIDMLGEEVVVTARL